MAKSILVVDDSVTVRQQLTTFLQGNGYQVATADGGATALTKAKTSTYDMVITDINMPGVNGIDLIGDLRKLPGFTATPVFVLTTESTPDIMAKGKQAGATAWIVKPFKPDILLKGIQKVLGA